MSLFYYKQTGVHSKKKTRPTLFISFDYSQYYKGSGKAIELVAVISKGFKLRKADQLCFSVWEGKWLQCAAVIYEKAHLLIKGRRL